MPCKSSLLSLHSISCHFSLALSESDKEISLASEAFWFHMKINGSPVCKKKKKNLQSTNSGKSYLQIKQCSDLSHVWRFLQLATNSVLLECCSARTSANLLTGLRLQRVSTLSRYSSPRAICSRSPTHTQKASSSRSAFAHSPHLSLEVCSPESANRPVMFGSHRVLIF